MSAMKVFRIRNFDPNVLTYSPPTTNSFGGKVVYINTTDRKQVYVQTPKMRGSIQKFTPTDKKSGKPTGDPKYSLRCSFGFEPKGTVEQYHEILKNWDEEMVNRGHSNCVSWLHKKAGTGIDTVEEMYSSMVNISVDKDLEPDGKYPDSVRFKMQVGPDGTLLKGLEIYDEDETEIKNVNDLPNSFHVIAIVRCTGVWFASGKFGISWRVAQMQVFRPARITGYSILPDLDPVPENEPAEIAAEPEQADESAKPEPEEESEEPEGEPEPEEESEEPEAEPEAEEESEPTPEPSPEPVKKKRGRKPKTTKKKSLLEDF
jgi:hypothetical protein